MFACWCPMRFVVSRASVRASADWVKVAPRGFEFASTDWCEPRGQKNAWHALLFEDFFFLRVRPATPRSGYVDLFETSWH